MAPSAAGMQDLTPFAVSARSGAARAGVLHTPHGDVRTPAFVPLASTATVKSLHASEVAALGYELVLGNTFHLFIQPGPDLIHELGGLHEFMGWRGAIVTDSGGYQVFSMGHGSVAEEVKRRRDPRESMVLSIEEEGVRFRSYLDGSERFMGPETSMEIQGALGTDIALAFDECTPFHVERDYTARSLERTQRWLERCLNWRREHAPGGQLFYGIVQGGVYEDLRAEATAYLEAAPGVDGIAIGGSLGRRRSRSGRWWAGCSMGSPTSSPGTCWASATWMISCMPWGLAWTPSTARPPPAWPGTALRSWRRRSRAGASTSTAPPTGAAGSRSTSAAAAPPAPSTPGPTCTT